MARIPVNFTGVDAAGDFNTYDPGEYILEVTKAAQKTAASSGNVKLQVTFQIHAGPNGSNANVGKFMTDSYSFTEQSRGFLLRFLNACGISREMAAALDDQQLIGRMIVGQITKREWPQNSGSYRNSVEREKPYGSAGGVPGAIPGTNGTAATAPPPMLLTQVPGAAPAPQPVAQPQPPVQYVQPPAAGLAPYAAPQQQQAWPSQVAPAAPPAPTAPTAPVAAPQMVPPQYVAPQIPTVPQVPGTPPAPMAPPAPPKPPGQG